MVVDGTGPKRAGYRNESGLLATSDQSKKTVVAFLGRAFSGSTANDQWFDFKRGLPLIFV